MNGIELVDEFLRLRTALVKEYWPLGSDARPVLNVYVELTEREVREMVDAVGIRGIYRPVTGSSVMGIPVRVVEARK